MAGKRREKKKSDQTVKTNKHSHQQTSKNKAPSTYSPVSGNKHAGQGGGERGGRGGGVKKKKKRPKFTPTNQQTNKAPSTYAPVSGSP